MKALTETICFLLSHGGNEFKDHRIERKEWAQIKPSTPAGKAPVLEIYGEEIHQSAAVCRYLAKQFGLNGSNDWEALETDATVDTFTDFRTQLALYHCDQDEVSKEKKWGPLKK